MLRLKSDMESGTTLATLNIRHDLSYLCRLSTMRNCRGFSGAYCNGSISLCECDSMGSTPIHLTTLWTSTLQTNTFVTSSNVLIGLENVGPVMAKHTSVQNTEQHTECSIIVLRTILLGSRQTLDNFYAPVVIMESYLASNQEHRGFNSLRVCQFKL